MKIFTFFPNGGVHSAVAFQGPRPKPLYENLYGGVQSAGIIPIPRPKPKEEINWDSDPFLYRIYDFILYLPPGRIIFHCKINMSLL